ncbi:MAG: hypothetical protein ACK47B_07725 [Armatimonadota bacterium]
MARDFGIEAATVPAGTQPTVWITHDGFERATGIDLRTPVRSELLSRIRDGLDSLDHDFPSWFTGVAGEREDGLVLRFRDTEALNNVVSKLRDRGLNDR